MDVLERLLQSGAITEEDSLEIGAKSNDLGFSLENALLQKGVPKGVVLNTLAEEFGVQGYEIGQDEQVPHEILQYLPEESARHYQIVPLKIEDSVLIIGANNPDNLKVREVLNFVSLQYDLPCKLVFVLQSDIEKVLESYESLSGEIGEALGSLDTTKSDKDLAALSGEDVDSKTEENLQHIKEDAPVTKIVATILRYAIDGGASDIHIEPTDKNVVVRFRVDGILAKSLELPKNVQAAVVARIKILSSMRLDEKRKPQDGRFSSTFDGRKIDFRVSILPTNYGEKAVMRILDNIKGVSTLEETGISPHNLQTIRRMLKEPYGIILISGPTGSGKSTTLYAMLSEIDCVSKNVLSLEDPIEYNIKGVSQSQVRPEIGYTFANGLRSALRQDPDVIMVGEIRDKETAQLAVQAALTGHLVLSTIHTNNSIGVVPRLIDMGVDPYLIAPTLKLAIAQRLSRRLCPNSGKEVPVDASFQMMIDEEFKTLPEKYRHLIPTGKSVMHPEATSGCASGTKGRSAVMEVLEISSEIQELILKNGSEEDILAIARKNGFMSMKEDAIIKALDHVIPYEEINNFGTKIGLENAMDQELEDVLPVNNSPIEDVTQV